MSPFPAAPHRPCALSPLLLAVALLVVAGCETKNQVAPEPGPLDGMPAASSPEGVVNALVWCNRNLSSDGYRLLFTADFRFAFSAIDSAGNPYRDQPWTRDDELGYFRHVVDGDTAGMPAVRELILVIGATSVQNDPRPGKEDPERHKLVTVRINLTIETVDDTWFNVSGKSAFYVVRGDSAAIPDDLGRSPDPATWYIERWEDQTIGTSGAATVHSRPAPHRAQPGTTYTWGWLKSRYR